MLTGSIIIASDSMSDIPVALAKTVKFRRGTTGKSPIYQVLRLIYNSVTYPVTVKTRGAVMVDATGLTWQFVAPDNRYDWDELRELSVANFLETLAASCEENPVAAWTEFADWLSTADVVESIQALLASTTKLTHRDLSTTNIPEFTAPGTISGLFRWLEGIYLDADSADNTTMKYGYETSATNRNRFDIPMTFTILDADTGETTDAELVFRFLQ
ncbi:MAG: hypothetical protein LIO86_15435 [Lachnospiraceae bacterium]|nr:hypothetical protein [Lachnospiraceae bacterium]